jgi:hypothetical protein
VSTRERRPADHEGDGTGRPKIRAAANTDSVQRLADVPVAAVLAIHPTLTTRLVKIRCPYCRRTHLHGWPYGQSGEHEPRVSHCGNGAYCFRPREFEGAA